MDNIGTEVVAVNTAPGLDQLDSFDVNTADIQELAEWVRAKHASVKFAARVTLHQALAAGDALIEGQKRLSVRDQWERWVQENCFLKLRTAKLYMQLARHRARIQDECEQNPDLSLRGARSLISIPKGPPSEPEDDVSELAEDESPLNPVAIWATFSNDQKRLILDHEGRVGLSAIMSPALLTDLSDHVVGLTIATTSTSINLAITLTKALRSALSAKEAEIVNAVNAIKQKLKGSGRSLHDIAVIIVAEGEAKKTRKKRK